MKQLIFLLSLVFYAFCTLAQRPVKSIKDTTSKKPFPVIFDLFTKSKADTIPARTTIVADTFRQGNNNVDIFDTTRIIPESGSGRRFKEDLMKRVVVKPLELVDFFTEWDKNADWLQNDGWHIDGEPGLLKVIEFIDIGTTKGNYANCNFNCYYTNKYNDRKEIKLPAIPTGFFIPEKEREEGIINRTRIITPGTWYYYFSGRVYFPVAEGQKFVIKRINSDFSLPIHDLFVSGSIYKFGEKGF